MNCLTEGNWKSPQIEFSNYQPSNSSNLEILKKVDSVQMERFY